MEDLNFRICAFDYGSQISLNKPCEIIEGHVKKGCLIMSSSEMRCLIENLNLMIGHLIPEKDECWLLYLQLKNIITVIWSPKIHITTHEYLQVLIEEYLLSLTEKFPGCLKPKHHYLTHYATSMKNFGPLGKLSCLRDEGKHKIGKNTSNATTSRINSNKASTHVEL